MIYNNNYDNEFVINLLHKSSDFDTFNKEFIPLFLKINSTFII